MKMRIHLLFILFAVTISSFAQEVIDSVKYRFVYEVSYAQTVEGRRYTDVCNLDVGRHCSIYYSWLEKRKKEIIDSINNSGSVSIDMVRKATKNLNGQQYNIYKNYPQPERITYLYTGFGEEYVYHEDIPAFNWRIEQCDTMILGYNCQVANADFRGRNWHVWYTEDIPIPERPWKLCGLPGLILKAEDSEGIFGFECIGIDKVDTKTISFFEKKENGLHPIRVTEKNIQ